MRTIRPVLSAIVVAAAGLLVGCGKGDDAKAKSQEPASSPAKAPEPPKVSPVVISIAANGSVNPVVSADWPIVVEVQIDLKPDAGDSLTLSNPAGAWSDALKLECKGKGDVDRSSLFTPAYASEKSIELTHERSGVMVWILDRVDPAALPEGTWQIRAVLDEKKLGNAVPPGLSSHPISVVVAPGAPTPSRGAAQRKCLAIMTASTWKNDAAKALAAAAAHLAKYPDDVAVLFMKGQILRSQGQKAEALASFEAALHAANMNQEKMSENLEIVEAIADLQREPAPK